MNFKHIFSVITLAFLLLSCVQDKKKPIEKIEIIEVVNEFNYFVEQFADIKILRYKIDGFEQLTLAQKKYVYYLSQAGLAGRDIIYDQNYRHNLTIRRALENIHQNYTGNKNNTDWNNFETYLKQVWFANGIHHHYSTSKFKPQFS